MVDLASLLMSIFRLGLILDELLLFISSGLEELLYWYYLLFCFLTSETISDSAECYAGL